MTHEEQIKWMTDRIAHLETQYESAMGMVETLMGKLKPLTEKAVEAEREACADIAENWNSNGFPRTGVAAQIRARGQA
jgi:hypothetical protein